MDTTLIDKLSFQFPLRKYQRLILERVASLRAKESKFHIVAPPGSGKTIVGLELIRQFKQPAVIFSPTSTIQLQWKEKIKMFIPEHSKIKTDEIVSTDANHLKFINTFTYQLISTPSESLDFITEAAIFEWKDNLVLKGLVSSDKEATTRINLLRKNNPTTYRREISKYYKSIKDKYLRDPQFDGQQILHPNAKKLINDLVTTGVKTIIMDESHHLLDYWALVLKELIKRIDGVQLIGLTATPPISAANEDLENYISIMGEIDFEIPTPAVVKEGNLAPYQDLVFFCHPTVKEKEFIDSLEARFLLMTDGLCRDAQFVNWLKSRILHREIDGHRQDWSAFFNVRPLLAIAGVKIIKQVLKLSLPWDIVETEEMDSDVNIDDWVEILEDYTLNSLILSENKIDQEKFKEIALTIRSFGYNLGESGIRQQRGVVDKILALSQSKYDAVIKILTQEMEGMGDELRTVIMTDFEKQTATDAKILRGILDPDAGGAVGVFRRLVNNPQITLLEPVLVTGNTVLIETDKLDHFIEAMKQWQRQSGLKFKFSTKKTEYDRIVEIIGSGTDWKSNTYVRMLTDLFEKGITKCIVGTRGLLGEGWDSISLNTLIDLTQATTSMMVNQIRGRSIRLDPNSVTKLANNWDVVCIDSDYEKGDSDFNRFEKKQGMFYGLGSQKRILKGLLHVDEYLAFNYHSLGFKKILYHLVNIRMLAKAKDRQNIYKQWEVGAAYSNFEYSATKIDAKDLKFKTVFTLRDSLIAIFNNLAIALGSFIFWYFYLFSDLLELSSDSGPIAIFLSLAFLAGIFVACGLNIKKYITRAFIELPLDSFLLDIGKSLLKSLRESGLVDGSQSVDNVRVVKDFSGYYDLNLDYSSGKDSRIFSDALREVLAPITDQRYLISRSEDKIKMGFYSPLWWMFRKVFRIIKQEKMAYHAVPSVLSVTRKKADIFAKNWQEYVGGGGLVYTRSVEGVKLLLKIRKSNYRRIKRMTFDVWK